mgnify:FL=1
MNLSEAKKILSMYGYNIDSWKDDENFRRYLRKNNIDVSLTPDDLLRKHYDVFQKLTDIEKDFKR